MTTVLWMAVLFIGGILLLLSEFILPGGVLGVIGVILLITCGAVGVNAYPDLAMFIIVGESVAAVAALAVGLVIMSKTGVGRMLMLEKEQRAEDGYTNMADDLTLIGARATALTTLRPSGTIMVGERRIDALADSAYIDQGAPVRIVKVHGNRVVVEALTESDSAPTVSQ